MNAVAMKTLTNDEIIERASAAGALSPHKNASAKYSFVPTLQVVDLLRTAGWQPISARQSSTRVDDREGFQKHIIRFTMPELAFSNQERVDVLLYNSHDLGSAFHLSASIWRKICGNGLMVATDLFNYTHKHIGFKPSEFVDSAYKIADNAGQIAQKVDQYKTIELQPNERGIFAAAAHSLLYDQPSEAPVTPERLLREKRHDDKGKDLWTTYNVLQENIIKGGMKGSKRDANGKIRHVTTRPVKSIDRDIKLNKALWILTEKMAAIKQAA